MFIGSLADESGWKWMTALNTLYTRCIRLHPFYFRATNDVKTFHVPYLSSLFPFSAAEDVSCEDAQRMQRGYSGRLTDDNGHRTCVVRICRGFTSYTAEVHPFLKFCAAQNFLRG